LYTIQHNPARLYNYDKTGISIAQHKHAKILELKGKRQISSVQSADQGSLVTVVTCVGPTGHFIPPVTCIFKKIYETRNDEWHRAWINPRMPYLWVDTERDFHPVVSLFHRHTAGINTRVPFLGVDTERDFHPVVSLFHQTYKADKIRSLYLSNRDGTIHTQRTWRSLL